MRMAETRRKSQQISAISRNFGEIIVALLCDYIIPAHAGIHCPTTPMPEKNTPSFPRRREFTVPLPQCPKKNTPSFPRRREFTVPRGNTPEKILRHSREGGNPHSRACGNDVEVVLCGMRCPVGLGGISVEFPRARELWIPAFAGMTGYFPGRWGNGTINSRDVEVVLCGMRCPVGLGGISVEFPRARELWIPAFAGMDGVFSWALG